MGDRTKIGPSVKRRNSDAINCTIDRVQSRRSDLNRSTSRIEG
jgi:hypothetical protein